ncbi:hypothetical protein ILYODFUR_036704, partial [Ilyodon furcidens]
GVLLTGSMLEFLTCGDSGGRELRKILLVPEKQQPSLQAYHSVMCSREEGQRSEYFRQLSQELREQINTQSVADKVCLIAVSPFVCLPTQNMLEHNISIIVYQYIYLLSE